MRHNYDILVNVIISHFKKGLADMKKFLSFLLAALMIATMAVSIGARGIFDDDKPLYNESASRDFLLALKERNYKEYLDVISSINSKKATLGTCKKCGGTAIYRIEGYEVVWTCLEKDCDGKGTESISVSEPDSGTYHVNRCNECGKFQLVWYVKNGKICYYCINCGKGNVEKPDISDLTPIFPDYPWYDYDYDYNYSKCPECGKNAVLYYSDNRGTYYWHCYACGKGNVSSSFFDHDYGYNYSKCPECGKNAALYYSDSRGTYYWHCYACGEGNVSASFFDRYYNYNYSKCPECGKNAALYYSDSRGTYYWHCYACGKGNVSASFFDNHYSGYGKYTAKVYCSIGGTYDITNGNRGNYGDKKTITFTPYSGYILKEVYIDGKNYGYMPEVTITLTEDVSISAYFVKADKYAEYTIKTSVKGKGSIVATLNGKTVDPASVNVRYYDKLSYKFVPSSKNYYVASASIDNRYIDSTSGYTLNGVYGDHTIRVEFKWRSPYSDKIADRYVSAIEFVTESGIMTPFKDSEFGGTGKAKLGVFVASLAEMADTKNVLNSDAQRLEWAKKNGIIASNADEDETLDVQTACEIVKAYLLTIEDINNISFKKVNDNASAEEIAVAINMVAQKTYDDNRTLNRYDIAAVCYLLARLEY